MLGFFRDFNLNKIRNIWGPLTLILLASIGTTFLVNSYVFSPYYMTNKTLKKRKSNRRKYNENKAIVFDMDETLGNFVQLGTFFYILEEITGKRFTQEQFNKLLDLYPELLRPDIVKILKYVARCKQNGKCKKVYIFTNNQGPKSWAYKIKNYFESKIGNKAFDRIIGSYKVNNEIREPNRTSHEKTYADMKNITKISNSTLVLFFDDQKHPGMLHENVRYILLPRYEYYISPNVLVNRFLKSKLYNDFSTIDYGTLKNELLYRLSQYTVGYTKSSIYEEDIQASQEIMTHVKDFFKCQNSKTRKNRT